MGIRSLRELIIYAKANPSKLSYGATGVGSLPALAMESLKRRADIDVVFVPYQSASKIALDVMGGHLDLAVAGLPALLEHIKAGKVTGVGVMSKERDIGAPDLPSAEDTPELERMDFNFWTGLFAPKGTPTTVVMKLNGAFADVIRDEKVRTRFRARSEDQRAHVPDSRVWCLRSRRSMTQPSQSHCAHPELSMERG